MLHAGERRPSGERIAAATLLRAGERDVHVGDAGHAPDHLVDAAHELPAHLALVASGSQLDGGHAPVDAHAGHHAERHHVAPEPGKEDRTQRFTHALGREVRHAATVARGYVKGNVRARP